MVRNLLGLVGHDEAPLPELDLPPQVEVRQHQGLVVHPQGCLVGHWLQAHAGSTGGWVKTLPHLAREEPSVQYDFEDDQAGQHRYEAEERVPHQGPGGEL